MNVHIDDNPGTLAKMTELLAKNKINILMSQSKVIERGHMAEWSALLDISEADNAKRLLKDLGGAKFVKKFEMSEK
jgi:uncharacterized protein with ACT and thioredoxin-like domain